MIVTYKNNAHVVYWRYEQVENNLKVEVHLLLNYFNVNNLRLERNDNCLKFKRYKVFEAGTKKDLETFRLIVLKNLLNNPTLKESYFKDFGLRNSIIKSYLLRKKKFKKS
jgi:hypothetical protein